MSRKLSIKQQKFIEKYLATGNGVQSALAVYDVKSDKAYSVAASIAHENLNKPEIKKAISERLSDDLLAEKHEALLMKTNQEKRVDPDTGEIKLVDVIDEKAVKYGLDMAYKLKGAYAAEKRINLNADAKDMLTEEERSRLNALITNEGE